MATWVTENLPPETTEAVRAGLGALVDDVVDSVRRENPVYANVLGGPEGMGIRLGIEQAVRSFLDAAERGAPPGEDTGEVWRRLGEAEFQAGRNLDSLRAAFRTGTRAAWRGAANLAAAAGVEAPVVIALAEAIFLYTDQLAADVAEGYMRMQSDEAGERERRRRRLASLLLDPEPHDPEAIAHAAELARWPLPRTVAVLAIDRDSPGEVTRRLDIDVLAGADAEGSYVVVPDPDGPGRGEAIARALDGIDSALGPTGSPGQSSRSLRWARLALGLVDRGALPSERPTKVADHLATVILLQDRELAAALVADRLDSLEQLPAAERDRLLETLAAWLAHQRHTPSIAEELHVHPQTVRYRMGRIRELVGETLDSAEGRFEFELALKGRKALRG